MEQIRSVSTYLDTLNGVTLCSSNDPSLLHHCQRSLESAQPLPVPAICSIHLKSLRTKLWATKKKTDVLMSKYLMDVRATVDALRAARLSIEEDEIVSYVVDGLDESYHSFLTHLHFSPASSFDELVSHLLQEEDLLKRSATPATNPIAFTAQQVTPQNNPTHPTGSSYQQNNYSNNFRGRFRGRGRFRNGRFNGGHRGGYANNYNNYQHPHAPTYNPPPSNYRHPEHYNPPFLPTPTSIGEQVCQICNIVGHTART